MDHAAYPHAPSTAPSAPPPPAPAPPPPHPQAAPILPSPRKSSRAFRLHDNDHASPPLTPPPRKRRSKTGPSSRSAALPASPRRHSKGKQPVQPLQQTPALELRQQNPSAAAAAAPQHGHNHSWNSTTRDSVVDNLLFSLDNLSRQDVGEIDSREDEERSRYLSSLASQFTMNRSSSSRARGHTHSSSTSDYDRHVADSPQSKFSMSSKGRRSNSSSNFPHHSLAGRVKSGARALSGSLGRSSSEYKRQTNDHPTEDANWLEPSRLALAGKSLSMDYIHAEGTDAASVLGRGRPVPSIHSKYESNSDAEAAPEPFIAAGPRKMQNPTATGPVYVNSAANPRSKASTLRKITTQTDLRSSAGVLPSPPIPQDIRNQAADFVRTSSMLGNAHPGSAPDMPAPSPRIAARRDPSPPREKPGFFKRVFGGASSRAVSTPVDRPRSNQVSSPDSNDRSHAAAAPNRSVSQASAGEQARPETRPSATAPSSPAPPTLNKKSSSFFRRRKKSTSEAMPPPPLPIAANHNLDVRGAQPSPSISSLRKVMDPFLTQEEQGNKGLSVPGSALASRPNTSDSRNEDSEDPDMFHSGYTPPLDAALGAPQPISREQSLRQDSQDDNSPARMKVKKRRPEALAREEDGSMPALRDRTNDQAIVSPLSMTFLDVPSPKTPANMMDSRPSTGEGIIASAENSPIPQQAMREFSAGTNVSLDMNDDGWLGVKNPAAERPVSKTSERLFLQPTLSEERLGVNGGKLSPIEKHLMSPMFIAEPAEIERPTHPPPERLNSEGSLTLPTLQVENGVSREINEPTIIQVPSDIIDDGAEYRDRARKIFEGDEEDVSKQEAAAWMGERNLLSTRTLQAYMHLFDFSGLNILASLRILCSRLMLRGETQQFDRIITALSARWCECNPSHGFKAQDVVHTIIYSLILLNTDLHLADIGEKMSRSAYVKNTLPTIRRVVADAAPNAFDDTLRPAPTALRPSLPWSSSSASMPSSPAAAPAPDVPYERPESSLADIATKRLSIRPGVLRSDSDQATPDSAGGQFNMLVTNPWNGTMRGWEMEVESVLKSFFNSIRTEPLPLHNSMMAELPTNNRNLSVVDLNSNLKRTASIVSKAPSDNMSYRSKQGDFRSMTMRWNGRSSRSRPKIYPASTVGSSRTSFDDGSGIWSPADSSKYSFSKTLTSASVNSFSNFSTMDSFKHSIGFANALSQAIIREETLSGDSETFSVPGGLLDDDSLALEGAPWAKEGLVKHKHHMETQDRKAKDRNWTECFAVLSKGKLTLFNFNTSSKTQSLGRKNHFSKGGKAASVTGATVGGGDWMENAEQLDVFILRQTIASTLPPPGYSKARPHVWALSLPTGAVHLFQVGTPEIAEEFMSTANYWSARLSKEPLAGGVSNIEYGWSENIINQAILERPEFQHPPSSMSNHRSTSHGHSMSTDRGRRSSLQSSMRSSFDAGFGNAKAKLPGDKTQLMDWQPPSQSMMASQLMEVDQLKQLTTYVQTQEEELERHNELKHAIDLAFSPRHPNHNRAMANWQRKSDYLLREIVKFRTYIDSLVSAAKAKETFYARKAEARPLSPVSRNDSSNDDHFVDALPTIDAGVLGDVTPRNVYTSG